LHDDARTIRVIEFGIVQGNGIRMLEASHHERFAREAFAKDRVCSDMLVHDLDNDFSAEVGLAGKENLSHAAFAEEPNRLITTEKYAALHGGVPRDPEAQQSCRSSVGRKLP